MGRYVFHNNTAGTDHTIIADGHAGQHTDVGSDPHIIAHGYRTGIFEASISHGSIYRMAGCVEPAIPQLGAINTLSPNFT